jgi:ribonucleotide monophosphatase NagD (HAD superfamily)
MIGVERFNSAEELVKFVNNKKVKVVSITNSGSFFFLFYGIKKEEKKE